MSMKKSPNNQKKADVKTDEKAAGSQETAATHAPTVRASLKHRKEDKERQEG